MNKENDENKIVDEEVPQTENSTKKVLSKFEKFNNGKDESANFDAEDIKNAKSMPYLCYIGFLVLVPLFAMKESKFSRFHQNQGLILFITEIILSIIHSVLTTVFYAISYYLGLIFSLVFGLVWLGMLLIAILGIVNVSKGMAKRLPIIGKFNILK